MLFDLVLCDFLVNSYEFNDIWLGVVDYSMVLFEY